MKEKTPTLLVCGKERSTFEVWEKLEVAHGALGVLDGFNERRPHLATELTLRTAEEVRKRLGGIEILMPKAPQRDDRLESLARDLLLRHTPEEALDILRAEHGLECDINGLIHLAGSEAYFESLSTEADVLVHNAISHQQIAALWNEAKRPAAGGPFWTPKAVEELLAGSGRG